MWGRFWVPTRALTQSTQAAVWELLMSREGGSPRLVLSPPPVKVGRSVSPSGPSAIPALGGFVSESVPAPPVLGGLRGREVPRPCCSLKL